VNSNKDQLVVSSNDKYGSRYRLTTWRVVGHRHQETVPIASKMDTKKQQRHCRHPRPCRCPRHHFSDGVTGNQVKSATAMSKAKPVRDGDAQWAQMMVFHPRKMQHLCSSDNKKGIIANVAAERHAEEVERLCMPQVVQLRGPAWQSRCGRCRCYQSVQCSRCAQGLQVVVVHAAEMMLRTRSHPISDFPSRPLIYIPLPLHSSLDLHS
jgi:hypothetical protein